MLNAVYEQILLLVAPYTGYVIMSRMAFSSKGDGRKATTKGLTRLSRC